MQEKIITCKQLQYLSKCGRCQILGSCTNTTKLEKITCGENLLPFNSKSFTFLSLSKDLKIKILTNYKTREGHTSSENMVLLTRILEPK
jgi:hypothetical protein